MTRREAAIIECYTGYVTLVNHRECVYQYAQELLGRPVYTHEFAREDVTRELHEKSKEDFANLFQRIDDAT